MQRKKCMKGMKRERERETEDKLQAYSIDNISKTEGKETAKSSA